ncbi:putative receptor-like protein kinase [Platanthera guangdongensis]|uniref:Receptor-like protein kinase n=1 Tax=Platanthera guangdongensis TaxID=2320717 RepID=A0ABR2LW06_9ASPA
MGSICAGVGSALPFVLLASSLLHACIAFNPDDNYLIDCGSATNTSIGGRVFRADLYYISNPSIPNSVFASVISLYISSFDSSALYKTARIILAPFSYSFPILSHGRHLLRLYFFPFTFNQYVLTTASFAVSTQDFLLLSHFRLLNSSAAVFKEFLLNITTDFLTLTFTPLGSSSLAFVNAIELVSAPDDLIADHVPALNPPGTYAGLSHRVLETVYRVNMGGSKVLPDEDALWRTWIADENFLVNENFAQFVSSGETIDGGASEEIAPASVYSTGTEFVASKSSPPISNLTWKFSVDVSSSFMIRLHFCNILSEKLYFDVYINDLLAIKDLNLSARARAAPFYADFVAGVSDGSGEIRVSIGPSSSSTGNVSAGGMLNGLEIMSVKLSSGSSNGNIARFSNNLYEKKLSIILGSLIGALLLVIATVFLCMLLKKRRKM